MKASKFSDAQKAFILKQGADGTCRWRRSAARRGSARRPTSTGRRSTTGCCRRRCAAEAARGRERPAEEAGRRSVARQGDAAGRHPPKALRPGRKRKLVDGMWGVGRVDPAGLPGAASSTPRPTITSPAARPGRPRGSDQGDLRDAGALRLPARACAAAPRGLGINTRRPYRIYNELGLQLRNKTPKRRVKAKLREDRQEAAGPNEVWAMDFVHDQLATGKKIRILTVVDTFSRYCRCSIHGSATGRGRGPDARRVCGQIGYPKTIRVDNGSEFVSGTSTCGPMPTASRSTSPAGQADRQRFIEAFNGRFRAECLNACTGS
jgi:putative transposase